MNEKFREHPAYKESDNGGMPESEEVMAETKEIAGVTTEIDALERGIAFAEETKDVTLGNNLRAELASFIASKVDELTLARRFKTARDLIDLVENKSETLPTKTVETLTDIMDLEDTDIRDTLVKKFPGSLFDVTDISLVRKLTLRRALAQGATKLPVEALEELIVTSYDARVNAKKKLKHGEMIMIEDGKGNVITSGDSYNGAIRKLIGK